MDEMEPLRREAIRTLTLAVATDRLTIDQFESRLVLVRQAVNRATIDAIVADVLPSGGFTIPAGLTPARADHTAVAGSWDSLPVEPAEVLRIRTVMGSSKRAGSWTVPLRLELQVVMGELTIDLRDAVFCSDVLDVDLQVTLGSLTLIVPAGTQVENECDERFSTSSHSTRSSRGGARVGLLVRLSGRVRLSSIDIQEKRPSGEEREAPRWLKRLGGGE
ncbi:MAG TPA: hypothetical protein VF187_00675 [Gemmatimonadales bacterium]